MNSNILPIGPVVLAITVGVQWMIWLWRTFAHRAVDESEMQRYTSLVRPMFQADNDNPIYLGGAAVTVALAILIYWLWRRRVRPDMLPAERLALQARAQLHFCLAAVVVLVPAIGIGWIALNFLSAILGLAMLVLLYANPLRLPELSSLSPIADLEGQPSIQLSESAVMPESRLPASPSMWPWGTGFGLAMIFVIALLYIPHAEFVAGFNYQLDRYTHWNAYAMFPALAFRNGGALITQHYAQYGVGWPLVLAGLSRFTPLSYGLAIRVGVIWGCIYYGILFCFLQSLLRRTSWAFAGLAFALSLQCFGGMVGSHKWALPSGTVLRYSVDMLFFLTCLVHARGGRTWLGVPIGALAGCALLFGIDTGLYLTVCFLFYLVGVPRLQSRAVRLPGTMKFVACALPAFYAVAVTGLCVASRGTMFQTRFWSQWLEAVLEYGGGISDLPIADTMDNWRSYLILSLVLISYLLAIVWMLQRLWFRKATAEELITGLVALYGMATLLLFVGRSDPAYLRNVSIPYCVVLTRLLYVAYPSIEENVLAIFGPRRQTWVRRLLKASPWLATVVLLLTLPLNEDFRDYPGFLSTCLGNRWTAKTASEADYLFLSRHDAPLEPDWRADVGDFRAVCAAMRKLSSRGKTVAMLDMDDTEYLVEADIRPWFRYSPVLQTLLIKNQVKSVEQTLIDHPPDYVFYPAKSPLTLFHVTADDVYLDIRKVIRGHFVLEKRVAGIEIYRRQTASAAISEAIQKGVNHGVGCGQHRADPPFSAVFRWVSLRSTAPYRFPDSLSEAIRKSEM